MTQAAPAKKPTEAELEVLSVLWSRGDSTVREVHDILSSARTVGYTSILKTMQIMAEKGLVERIEAGKAHIYHPTVAEDEMQTQLLADLSQKLFAGSPGALAMHALSMTTSDDELEQIKAMIERRRGAT